MREERIEREREDNIIIGVGKEDVEDKGGGASEELGMVGTK